MDSQYLQTHLGKCLTDCLTEVSEKRPVDPIEYIAQWLYKHIENVNCQNQEAADKITLKQQEEDFEDQQERLSQMKEEKQRLKEEEAERQKELQAVQDTAGLPTLTEGEEPQETPRIEVQQEETEEQEEASGQEEKEEESEEQAEDQEHTEDNTDQQEDVGDTEEQEQDAE